jgi:hypothetical protein
VNKMNAEDKCGMILIGLIVTLAAAILTVAMICETYGKTHAPAVFDAPAPAR